jgi:hypothetical protein
VDTDGDGFISREEFLANGAALFPPNDVVEELKAGIAHKMISGADQADSADDCCIM